MTDYLARALEQRDEEEEEEISDALKSRSLPTPSGERSQEGGDPPKKEGKAPGTVEKGAARPTGSRGVERERTLTLAERLESLDVGMRVKKIPGQADRLNGGPLAASPEVEALRSESFRLDEEAPVPLLSSLRRARAGTDFVRRERRNLSVTLPETPAVAGSLSAEELDRLVERDARRYDGGFELY